MINILYQSVPWSLCKRHSYGILCEKNIPPCQGEVGPEFSFSAVISFEGSACYGSRLFDFCNGIEPWQPPAGWFWNSENQRISSLASWFQNVPSRFHTYIYIYTDIHIKWPPPSARRCPPGCAPANGRARSSEGRPQPRHRVGPWEWNQAKPRELGENYMDILWLIYG